MEVHQRADRALLCGLQNEVAEKAATAKEAKASRQSKAAAKRAARQAEKGEQLVAAGSASPGQQVLRGAFYVCWLGAACAGQ